MAVPGQGQAGPGEAAISTPSMRTQSAGGAGPAVVAHADEALGADSASLRPRDAPPPAFQPKHSTLFATVIRTTASDTPLRNLGGGSRRYATHVGVSASLSLSFAVEPALEFAARPPGFGTIHHMAH